LALVAAGFFERAYGLNGQTRVDHAALKEEMMNLTGCSERAVQAVLYGSSYTDLLGVLRAQIPGYVAQKTSEMEDFTSLPFYNYDGNTTTSSQPTEAPTEAPTAAPSEAPSPSPLPSPSSAVSLSSPDVSHLPSPVASPSPTVTPAVTSSLSSPSHAPHAALLPSPSSLHPQLFQPVLIPAALTLPDGSHVSVDEAVSKHYPALFLLALVAILPLTLLY